MLRFLFLIYIFLNVSQLKAEENTQEVKYSIKIKDHVFVPNVIEVPNNTNFKISIENLDNTIEEFESDDLKKEKLVGAKKTIILSISPLKSGEYKFYGDFHQKTAQGKIIVK